MVAFELQTADEHAVGHPARLHGDGRRGHGAGTCGGTFDYVQLLVFAILGAIGAIVWSAVDHRRSYPRLAAAARVALRHSLAHAMLSHGFAKICRLQFGDRSPAALRC